MAFYETLHVLKLHTAIVTHQKMHLLQKLFYFEVHSLIRLSRTRRSLFVSRILKSYYVKERKD